MLNRLGAYMHCIRPAAAPAAGAEGGADGSGGGGDGAAATTAADREALAQVLRLYLTASQLQGDFEGLSVAAEASALLASPDQQAAVGRALAQLSSGGAVAGEAAAEAAGGHSADEQQDPWQQQYEQYEQGLPTLAQLRYACAHLAAEAALQVGALAAAPPGEAARLGLQAPAPLTPARREAVQAAEDGSIQQLLELDAGNPKGLLVAALASDRPGQPPARAAGVHLSVHRLALEQGSDWWVGWLGGGWLGGGVHEEARPGARRQLGASLPGVCSTARQRRHPTRQPCRARCTACAPQVGGAGGVAGLRAGRQASR